MTAAELSQKVNVHDPSNKIRDQKERYIKGLGGTLAEYAVRKYIDIEASKQNLKVNISSKDESYMGQIDLLIEVNGKKKTLEVRSSFFYKTSFTRLFNVASIIGWYKTQSKPGEYKKDFYLFVIHFYNPRDIEDLLKREFVFYIMGGAPKELLNNVGEDTFLEQEGATYRTIKPITKGRDAVDIFNEILS